MDLDGNTNDPIQIQQYWYENLGDRDWDAYTLENHEILKRNIGFALYGYPEKLPSDVTNDQVCSQNDDIQKHQDRTNATSKDSISNNSIGYDNKQYKHIMTIYELLKKYHFTSDPNTILMRIIFIVGKIKCDKKEKKKMEICVDKQKSAKKDVFQSPLFVIKKCDQLVTFKTTVEIPCNIFIDDQGRVYKSWKFYLKNNKLPECVMYCPKNGQYCGKIISCNADKTDGEVQVKLDVLESPACSLGNKILNHTDTAGTVVSVGSTVALLAGIIPGIVVAPAILGAAAVGGLAVGVYAVGRSVDTLVDRKKHDQSIGLKDSEARNCWLNASVGVLTAGAGAASGLLTKAVGNGVKIGQGTKTAFNVIQASALIGSATTVFNSGYMMYFKLKNKEEISKLEMFQFASSVLFLCNSTVNFKTASKIITETQASTLKAYENDLRSNRHRKIFRKARLEGKRLLGQENSQAEIISGIKKIDNKDNFFAGLARKNKEFNQNNVKYTISSDGKVILNSAHFVDPVEFASLTNADRSNIFSNLPAPQRGIPETTFNETKISVNKWMDQYMNKQTQLEIGGAALKIATKFFTNDFNSENIALILSDLIEEARNYVLTTFTDFYSSLDVPVLKQLEELFPLVNTKMVILQFVKKIVIEISKALEIPIEKYLKMCSADIKMILKLKLEKWVSSLCQKEKTNLAAPFINGTKVKKVCQDCYGYYFATI